MAKFTVQCCYAAYWENTVVVEAEACAKAIEKANSDSAWDSIDDVGDTFVSAIREGEHDSAWNWNYRPPEQGGAYYGEQPKVPAKHAESALHGGKAGAVLKRIMAIPAIVEHIAHAQLDAEARDALTD